jgi:8-oxo-dGTP pyrophosphatase MutT (NUDIX family)
VDLAQTFINGVDSLSSKLRGKFKTFVKVKDLEVSHNGKSWFELTLAKNPNNLFSPPEVADWLYLLLLRQAKAVRETNCLIKAEFEDHSFLYLAVSRMTEKGRVYIRCANQPKTSFPTSHYIKLIHSNTKFTGSGVLFYCKPTGNFLFIKRSPTSDHGGTWCGVGGGVEEGESIEDACRREVREEVGFSEPYKLIPFGLTKYPNFEFYNHFAILDKEFEPTLNSEHTEYKWCANPPSPLHPGLKKTLKNYTKN